MHVLARSAHTGCCAMLGCKLAPPASGRRGDKTLKWALTALQPESEVSDESLWKVPLRHRTLSSRGAIDLRNKCVGELGHRVTQMVEDNVKEGMSVPERPAAREDYE